MIIAKTATLAMAIAVSMLTSFAAAEDQPFVLTHALLRGEAGDETVTVDVTLKIAIQGEGWAVVPLPPGDYLIDGDRTINNDRAFLVKSGTVSKAMIYGKGKHEIVVGIAVPVKREGLVRSAVLPHFPAMSVSCALTFPGGACEIVSEPGEGVEIRRDGSTTTFAGPLKDSVPLRLSWYDGNRKGEVPIALAVEQETVVYVREGILSGRSTMTLKPRHRLLNDIDILVPRAAVVSGVHGTCVRRWSVERTAEGDLLHVALRRASDGAVIVVILDGVVPDLPATLALAPLKVRGATAESGTIAIGGGRDVVLTVSDEGTFERMEIANLRNPEGETRYAFAYHSAPGDLRVAAERKTSRVEAEGVVAYNVERELMTGSARFLLRVSGAPLRIVRFGKSGAMNILGVTGEHAREWRDDGNVVTVDLKEGVMGEIVLTLEFQAPALVGRPFPFPTPVPLDAAREQGTVTVRLPGNAEFLSVIMDGLRQTSSRTGVVRTFAYDRQDWRLTAEVREVTPRIDVAVDAKCFIREDRVVMEETFRYRVGRTPIYNLLFTLSEGFVPTEVRGTPVGGWRFDPSSRKVTVDFVSPFLGEGTIVCVRERRLIDQDGRVPISGIIPQPSDTFRGEVAIVPDESWEVAVEEEQGIGVDGGRRTFIRPEWRMTAILRRKQPLIDATVTLMSRIDRGAVATQAVIRYCVTHAVVREFALRLPDGAANTVVGGENILATEERDGILTVIMAKPVKGEQVISVTYQQLLGKETAVTLTPVRPLRVDCVKGFVGVAGSEGGIDIRAVAGDGMAAATRKEIPREAQAIIGPDAPILFSYAHPEATARLEVTGHDVRKIAGARIVSSELATAIHDDGTVIHEMSALVVNESQQVMKIGLGETGILWSASIFGIPVKPSVVGKGEYLIPISRAVTGAMAFDLKLVWIERRDFPADGVWSLAMPKCDLRVEACRWKLSLPDGFAVVKDEGNVKRIRAASSLAAPSLVGAVTAKLAEGATSLWRAIPRPVRELFVITAIVLVIGFGLMFLFRRAMPNDWSWAARAGAFGGAAALLIVSIALWRLTPDSQAPRSVRPSMTKPMPRTDPAAGNATLSPDGVREMRDVETQQYASNRMAQERLTEYAKKQPSDNFELARVQKQLEEEGEYFKRREDRKKDGMVMGKPEPSVPPMTQPVPSIIGGSAIVLSGRDVQVANGGYVGNIFRTARAEGALPIDVRLDTTRENVCEFANDFTGGVPAFLTLSLVSHRGSYMFQILLIGGTMLLLIVVGRFTRMTSPMLPLAVVLLACAGTIAGGGAVPYTLSVLAGASIVAAVAGIRHFQTSVIAKGA